MLDMFIRGVIYPEQIEYQLPKEDKFSRTLFS